MVARRMFAALTLVTLLAFAAPAVGAEDATDLPTGTAPAQQVLDTASELRGPGEPAVRVNLDHTAPERVASCTRECGRFSLRVEFTADGTRLPAVNLNLNLIADGLTVLAPEGLAAGTHEVRAVATVTYTPGTEPPGGSYQVTLSDPYVVGETFSSTTESPVPGALASLGVLSVGGMLVAHYVREVR